MSKENHKKFFEAVENGQIIQKGLTDAFKQLLNTFSHEEQVQILSASWKGEGTFIFHCMPHARNASGLLAFLLFEKSSELKLNFLEQKNNHGVAFKDYFSRIIPPGEKSILSSIYNLAVAREMKTTPHGFSKTITQSKLTSAKDALFLSHRIKNNQLSEAISIAEISDRMANNFTISK